jgi:hypothetical protein
MWRKASNVGVSNSAIIGGAKMKLAAAGGGGVAAAKINEMRRNQRQLENSYNEIMWRRSQRGSISAMKEKISKCEMAK